MFASLVTRFASRTVTKTQRDYSAEFKARRAAQASQASQAARTSHSPDGLPSMLGRDSRSERDANAALVEDFIRRETAKARDMQRAGHRLFKATARALVDASSK